MSLNNKGFSLVELVVVITIIAILTLVGAVSYRNTVRDSRDQKRIVNLQKLRSDLELFRSGREDSVYPVALSELTTVIPPDPQSGLTTEYVYTPFTYDGTTTCDNVTVYCTTYVLSTPLEVMGTRYEILPNSEQLVP